MKGRVLIRRCALTRITATVLLLGLAGCAAGMSRDELLREMQEGNAPLIVDVRSQDEFDRDHVPGAVHIPFYSVTSSLRQATVQSDARIVLYCEHGPRSGVAGLLLYLAGYRKIFSLEGSMKGWRAGDYPREMIVH